MQVPSEEILQASSNRYLPFLEQLWFMIIQGPCALVLPVSRDVPLFKILGGPGKGREGPLVAIRRKHLVGSMHIDK